MIAAVSRRDSQKPDPSVQILNTEEVSAVPLWYGHQQSTLLLLGDPAASTVSTEWGAITSFFFFFSKGSSFC